ncbi:MAG TPA: porphobilinogen synthase [Thermomicrobiales bacterium]|nr:porphobilinogen synthase [Thermomicrobiales bacterium]
MSASTTTILPMTSETTLSGFARTRRTRRTSAIRDFVREHEVRAGDFVYPLFVAEGTDIRNPIDSMPGQYQLSLDRLDAEIDELLSLGIRAVLLFGIPEDHHKDAIGSEAFAEHGIVQEAVRRIKAHTPEMLVITDVCACEYTDHGHCGVLVDGVVDNDRTIPLLAQTAVSHAEAGADIVAPSDMMDGRVAWIRNALDEAGFPEIPVMSYAAKYASAYYGPFRDAAGSTPAFGDRRSHQMDPGNAQEAMREIAIDLEEGADLIIVKPALAYLDILRTASARFEVPFVAYNVSGEYAMIKAAAERGWIDEQRIVLETLLSMKRAGADRIITYHAKDAARWLSSRP